MCCSQIEKNMVFFLQKWKKMLETIQLYIYIDILYSYHVILPFLRLNKT